MVCFIRILNRGVAIEKVHEIIFFNIGIEGKSENYDYYDLIKPGVSVLFGESKNYIIYYQIIEQSVQSFRIEEVLIDEDWLAKLTEFFLLKYRLSDVPLVSGLLKCSSEEDADGLYDYCKENGGRVLFKNPNTSIELGIQIFVVKQCVEGDFHVHNLNLVHNNNTLSLEKLNSGYFDLDNETVVYWRKK